jgi:ubiquinone biosynthesis protein
LGDLTQVTPLAAAPRLIGALWRLIRADALAPREIDALLTPGHRFVARGLRLLAGPEARRGRPGERLARVLEGEGPVAVKLGQFLSTRADIFGGAFADDLSRLKDHLTPFPDAVATAEVERALGRPLKDIFSSFDGPVGAASLAQVHAARLVDGWPVAVKVLRPNIESRVARDIRALFLAASLATRWVPGAGRLEPHAFAATISRALELELDLRFEAAGADELREAMAADGFMSAPRVVWEGVAKRVLTLGWAAGDALSDGAVLTREGLDRRRLANDLIRGFLAQALDHGVFHADLHEGNLFVDPGGKLIAVDYGIIGRLGPLERRYLAEILWGFLNRDYARVAQVHFDAGYVPAHHDKAAFAQALRAVGEPIFGRVAQDVSMSRLLAQLFDITGLFEMRLRPELVLLQKTMVTVEGVGRRIDPDLDIWAAAEPIVRRWITAELSPTRRVAEIAREARAALTRLTNPPTGAAAAPPAPAPRADGGRAAGGRLDATSLAIGALLAALAFAAFALLR